MIAIDLGSNSCRFLHVNCDNGEKIGEFEALVKTADRLHVSGKISLEAQERIISAIEEAKRELDFENETIIALTTEAMRQASNASDVLLNIKMKTGIDFQVIDAKQEASYTLSAVTHRLQSLNIDTNSFVLIDIGGGSTEVVFSFYDTSISQSFKVGIVGIAQQCKSANEVRKLLKTALKEVKAYIQEVYKLYNKPKLLVATAGTPTTISAYLLGMNYHNYDVNKINGYQLTCKRISQAFDALMMMSETERSSYVGVGRENLIAAGIIIVESFYNILGFESAIVVDDGLREGIAYTHCHSIS